MGGPFRGCVRRKNCDGLALANDGLPCEVGGLDDRKRGDFLSAGYLAAWRTASVRAGAVAGVVTALLGAAVSIVGVTLLLAVWHDAPTFAAIEGSGGLAEVFTLPVMVVVPGAFLATVGGLFGGALRRLRHNP